MAIKFFNVKTKEVRIAGMDPDTADPQISAFYNSSDLGINAHQGQDMGWRLAPEVVVEMNEIKRDELLIERIANRLKKPLEELNDVDILYYISAKTSVANAPAASDKDFSKEYLAEIEQMEADREKRRVAVTPLDELEQMQQHPQAAAPVQQESLADLEKRVELEERLARARATNAEAEAPSTTTTTTEARPSTTTTTTKSK